MKDISLCYIFHSSLWCDMPIFLSIPISTYNEMSCYATYAIVNIIQQALIFKKKTTQLYY